MLTVTSLAIVSIVISKLTTMKSMITFCMVVQFCYLLLAAQKPTSTTCIEFILLSRRICNTNAWLKDKDHNNNFKYAGGLETILCIIGLVKQMYSLSSHYGGLGFMHQLHFMTEISLSLKIPSSTLSQKISRTNSYF